MGVCDYRGDWGSCGGSRGTGGSLVGLVVFDSDCRRMCGRMDWVSVWGGTCGGDWGGGFGGEGVK